MGRLDNPAYLVRWRFGPNSLLNHQNDYSHWFDTFHDNKEEALDTYTAQLIHRSPSEKCEVEIYRMVRMKPGEPDPDEPKFIDTPENVSHTMTYDNEARNAHIAKMHKEGRTVREIADTLGLTYNKVYRVVRRLKRES